MVMVAPFEPLLVHGSAAPTEKVTGFPDAPPVALTVKAESPKVLLASVPKEMVLVGLRHDQRSLLTDTVDWVS